MKIEYKFLPFTDAKASADGNGSISGYASTFGNVDSYGDTIVPGAYAKFLPKFLAAGFIGWNHNWDQMIGTPTAAKEDDTGLFLTASFHSTSAAQDARTIAMERLDRGLSMGLSIGYVAHKWSFADSLDGKSQVRLLEEIEIFETSLVAVPADSYAQVVAAKAHQLQSLKEADPSGEPEPIEDDSDPSDDAESHERFADHTERVLLEVSALTSRATDISALRAKAGRVLSAATRRRLQSLMDELGSLLEATSQEDADPDPEPAKSAEQAEIAAMFDRLDTLAAIYAAPSSGGQWSPASY